MSTSKEEEGAPDQEVIAEDDVRDPWEDEIAGLEEEEYDFNYNEEDLFDEPPPEEECPICLLPYQMNLPCGTVYLTCCGKNLCSGCAHAPSFEV